MKELLFFLRELNSSLEEVEFFFLLRELSFYLLMNENQVLFRLSPVEFFL